MSPGKSIKGEKRLVRVGNYMMTGKVLGKGHFARVEEAVHGVLNVKVAVKIINVSELRDHYVKKNLKREASIMSKISHPNIVHLFETIETEKNYYIVTEIGSGGDLCTYVKSQRYGKLDERKSRPLARQLASAVGHLHDKGVVHRDLKMENILLDHSKEKIKLVDFGLSNLCKSDELLRTHCGSPEYAAPELYVSGRRYGAEVDIWSLGVVFYGMILGKLPFQTLYKTGVTHEEKRKHLMEETKRGLTMKHQKALMDCSHLFRNLIPKMLNPNSKERITMKELQKHAWIYGNQVVEFPSPDEDWEKEAITKISNFLEIPLYDIYSQITKAPYGPIGGIFNIEKLAHLIRKVKTVKSIPRIDFKVIKGISPHKTSVRPLTYTSRDRIVQNPDNEGPKRRPITAEGIQIQNELKATTNFPMRKVMNMCHRYETVGDSQSQETCIKDKTTTPSKMLSYLNEKISHAFRMYTKRNSNPSELKVKHETERSSTKNLTKPSTVPSKDNVFKKTGDSNPTSIAGLSMQNDTSSENSSMKQTARTRFIKYLCSPKYQRQVAAKKLRPGTAPTSVPTKVWTQPLCPKQTRSATPATVEPLSRPPALSRYLSYPLQSCRSSIQTIITSNRQSTCTSPSPSYCRDTSFTTTSRRRMPSGVPLHTARRAAIRKELAIRNSNQLKSKV